MLPGLPLGLAAALAVLAAGEPRAPGELRLVLVQAQTPIQAPPPLDQPVDPAIANLIDGQITSLLAPPGGGVMQVQRYAKPLPPPNAPGLGPGGTPLPPVSPRTARGQNYLVARAGDVTYATLDRGFNSDDPQAPIFATIYDVDALRRAGPLNGVRLKGGITYSRDQAAIQFDEMILKDGRQLPLKAIAISEADARTGVAKDVDFHVLQRYGGLLLASLIQGAGQVGQVLLQSDRQVVTDPTTGAVFVQGNANPRQAALGALLPVGQALTAAAAQQFNTPPTMSSPAGAGVGIVFLDSVALPADVVFTSPAVTAAFR